MSETLQQVFETKKEQALRDYFKFLSFQSVSTDPSYKPQVLACADWLAEQIKKLDFQVEKWETEGYPVIFASSMQAGPDQPTLLIYNHYDVQPVDPEGEWRTPPFQPTIRNGEVYARGAQDNKGQCFYVLLALQALLEKYKTFPINIKWCIEGEEECGSASLSHLLKDPKRRAQLKSDYLAIVDMGLPDKNTPAVTLGVRGIVTMEVRVQGSKGDLHSGTYGGVVYNPLHALVEILAQLRTPEGKVAVPGFYNDVEPLTPADKGRLALEFDAEEFERVFKALPLGGEKNYSPLERASVRPTLEINGIAGGYGGPGFKTVLPAKALAKVSCRLVPHQDPDKIGQLVKEHILKIAPPGVQVEVEIYPGVGKACRANPSSKVVEAFSKSYEELFQKPCKNIFSGGSIPVATALAEACGGELILLGFGLGDDQIHAPDEHFGIDRLQKGFAVIFRAIELLKK